MANRPKLGLKLDLSGLKEPSKPVPTDSKPKLVPSLNISSSKEPTNNSPEQFTYIDILTPAYKYSSELSVEQLHQKCIETLGLTSDDVEFFSLNNNRIGCGIKNTSMFTK